MRLTGYACAVALTVSATVAFALDPADKCESSKLKIAGKYGFCRLRAESKAVKTATTPDFSKCDAKYAEKWMQAEAGGSCPTTGDLTTQLAAVAANANRTAWELSGQPRFVDNADGTITDRMTELMWEKKTQMNGVQNFANPFDADNSYIWAGNCGVATSKYCQPTVAAGALCAAVAEYGTTGCDSCTGADGTCNATRTVWTVAADRNAASFAGHTDWRVPTREELISIVDYADTMLPWMTNIAFAGASCGAACADVTNPACSCTTSNYWSASSLARMPQDALFLSFDVGDIGSTIKVANFAVRVVRGGS